MKRNVVEYGPSGSKFVGDLPEGCQRCIIGEKIVLYTTGHCSVGCAYCPIPEDKQKIDDVFVNERQVSLDQNGIATIFEESNMCLASGGGITGGDPLEVPERTISYIRALRQKFGDEYHLHLYTSGIFFIDKLQLIDQLFDAGLDELRFHPKQIRAKRIWELAALAKSRYPTKSIGFEIPVIPDQRENIEELIIFADSHHLDFVNLNEYEFTESNFNKLSLRGFTSVKLNAAVVGSKNTAKQIIDNVKDKTKITIHYCSSGSKDSIQLVQRFKKRASQIKRPFDDISSEGELEYGRFMVDTREEFDYLVNLLEQEYDVEVEMHEDHPQGLVVETGWFIIDAVTSDLRANYLPNLRAEVLAKHPLENGPITFVDPR
jgi:pyruvate formate-lyase activating enzyme-like uncharacterized protein